MEKVCDLQQRQFLAPKSLRRTIIVYVRSASKYYEKDIASCLSRLTFGAKNPRRTVHGRLIAIRLQRVQSTFDGCPHIDERSPYHCSTTFEQARNDCIFGAKSMRCTRSRTFDSVDKVEKIATHTHTHETVLELGSCVTLRNMQSSHSSGGYAQVHFDVFWRQMFER